MAYAALAARRPLDLLRDENRKYEQRHNAGDFDLFQPPKALKTAAEPSPAREPEPSPARKPEPCSPAAAEEEGGAEVLAPLPQLPQGTRESRKSRRESMAMLSHQLSSVSSSLDKPGQRGLGPADLFATIEEGDGAGENEAEEDGDLLFVP